MSYTTEEKFLKAYEMASKTTQKFAPDIMLHFYAYYKKATQVNGFYAPPMSEGDIRNAFKVNALLQIKNISKQEAREKYIELVEEHIGEVT
ncbi:acyl-CoA-binding protein [Salegentibacter maritimus]|uniref:Acyl-CoA-binding protein n=1 Tax=Salegentibacter maritimus TaxID=2794347 RepID=A0ABS0TFZ4_9FLAO|nr:acyl-CoA-binding protein [Salegentibacter maritimus]MBI6115749.1 acyl-CoA-binding protein [Salegentibacter maritimus]MBI6119977.1 acyl-CoA-binding protein [Salegentibacter maritimus]